MVNSSRNIYFEIKKLITHPDYNKIDEGIELLVKSNNVLFFEKILQNCSIRNGTLIASESLTVTAPRQPLIDYALWNIIGKCPNDAKIDKSLLKNNIRNVKFRSYESYLHNYHYVERFPIGITEFKNLKNLDFSNAIISNLPKEISKLNKLSILNLTSNNIKQFQDEICNITSLKELILSNNSIKYLPEQLGNLVNLEILELDNNELKIIPDSINYLTKLKLITLNGNKIKTLTKSIGYIQNIKELNLAHNKLATLPKSINNLNNLIFLSLSNNSFVQFPKIELENLKELNLSDNDITIIPNEIQNLKNLEKIYLSGNRNLGVFESGISFLNKLKTIELGRTGKLKPKPKVLYLKNRIDVDSFLRSIKLLYKLEERTRSVNTIKSEISKQKLVSKSVERKTNKNIKRNISDVNDDIISNLSNFLNSDEIDKIDIGLNLILNLNNQEVFNKIFKKWEIKAGSLNYVYSNEGFEFDRYWYRDYCIMYLLTSAESNIVFPNKIQISEIKYLNYSFIENRYPDFISKLNNIEKIILNCKGQKLKDDFNKLNKLNSISLTQVNNLNDINFLNFKELKSIIIEKCSEPKNIDLANHNNLKTIEIKDLKVNSISIENNPQLESIIFYSVRCSKLTIANCPNLKNIEIKYSDKIPEFHFTNILTLNEIKIINSSLNNIIDFISFNINLVKIEIEGDDSLELKDSIKELQNLKELNLINNNIHKLPLSIGELRTLQILNLKKNKLINIPETISNLKELKSIDLRFQSGNTKELNSLNDIPIKIFKNKRLASVKVTWSSLKLRKFESKMAAANLYEQSGIISNY